VSLVLFQPRPCPLRKSFSVTPDGRDPFPPGFFFLCTLGLELFFLVLIRAFSSFCLSPLPNCHHRGGLCYGAPNPLPPLTPIFPSFYIRRGFFCFICSPFTVVILFFFPAKDPRFFFSKLPPPISSPLLRFVSFSMFCGFNVATQPQNPFGRQGPLPTTLTCNTSFHALLMMDLFPPPPPPLSRVMGAPLGRQSSPLF